MDDLGKREELDKIRKEAISCVNCGLSKTRNKVVFGEGNPDAEIMFIGEAPGANEDKEGIPFCGAAGKFLDEMLTSIGLQRDDIFIANTVKCRPPDNRDPEDSEKEACRHFLTRQIELIKPKVIVCLGRHASATLLPGQPSISKIHGKPLKKRSGIVYLPLYHPAAALHNGGLRQTLLNDFAKIPTILKKISKENNKKIDQDELKQGQLI
jgi:DNA polymerase